MNGKRQNHRTKRPGECISLIRYSKTSCGVDFLLNTATNRDKEPWFDMHRRYQADFFEFYFFQRGTGQFSASMGCAKRRRRHRAGIPADRLLILANGETVSLD